MGTNLTLIWTVYVDGEIAGFSTRKWHAQAIGDAVAAGHIVNSGDTEMRLDKWAYDNDPALWARILKMNGQA